MNLIVARTNVCFVGEVSLTRDDTGVFEFLCIFHRKSCQKSAVVYDSESIRKKISNALLGLIYLSSHWIGGKEGGVCAFFLF